MSNSYLLTAADLDDNGLSSPIMRAASNPNSSVLKAMIQHGASMSEDNRRALGISCAEFWDSDELSLRYDSPLLEAIRAERPANVALLLAAGVDPNGLSLDMLSRYSAQFVRFKRHKGHKTREEALSLIPESQLSLLTSDELSTRRTTRSRFWSSVDFVTTHQSPWPAKTALETAATTGNISLFDQIFTAGPDTSWWTTDSPTPLPPSNPLHSFLSTSTPLHAAIESGYNDMLMYILDHGYNPNILPLSTPAQCVTPLIATITSCTPPNLSAYDLLLSYPSADHNLQTPIYNIHILHFATALLSPSLLTRISSSISLAQAGLTALGHTLLHIACLPLDDTYIHLSSEKIYQSIHYVRTLNKSWTPLTLHSHPRNQRSGFISHSNGHQTLPDPPSTYFAAQIAVVNLLLQSSTPNIAAIDIDGNTPLHHLAGHRIVNEELVHLLCAVQGGEDVWVGAKNRWGWTPRDLFEDGMGAVVEGFKPFWGDGV